MTAERATRWEIVSVEEDVDAGALAVEDQPGLVAAVADGEGADVDRLQAGSGFEAEFGEPVQVDLDGFFNAIAMVGLV